MPVDFAMFVAEAESSMNAQESSEIKLRCAISRAYYGTYHLALSYADTIALPAISDCAGPTHRKLSAFFEGSMDKDRAVRLRLKKIGYVLKQLHESRVTADYRLDESVSQEDAESFMIRSSATRSEIEFLKSPAAA